jgi:transcriptional regulator with XRE-family HTH domain
MKFKTLADYIVEARKAKGWTQCRLADEIGMARSYLNSIERGGGQRISAQVLYSIANVLGTSIETLLGEERLIDTTNTRDRQNREIERLRQENSDLKKKLAKISEIAQ